MDPSQSEVDLAFSLREKLVNSLKSTGRITSASIDAAFRHVPRHTFVPEVALSDAYNDEAIVTQHVDGVPTSSCTFLLRGTSS